MDYFYLLVACLGAVHAASYGVWVKGQGNRAGAIFIFCLILLSLGLPVYKIVTQ